MTVKIWIVACDRKFVQSHSKFLGFFCFVFVNGTLLEMFQLVCQVCNSVTAELQVFSTGVKFNQSGTEEVFLLMLRFMIIFWLILSVWLDNMKNRSYFSICPPFHPQVLMLELCWCPVSCAFTGELNALMWVKSWSINSITLKTQEELFSVF